MSYRAVCICLRCRRRRIDLDRYRGDYGGASQAVKTGISAIPIVGPIASALLPSTLFEDYSVQIARWQAAMARALYRPKSKAVRRQLQRSARLRFIRRFG